MNRGTIYNLKFAFQRKIQNIFSREPPPHRQKSCTDMTGDKQELDMCFGHITLPGSDMMEKFFGKFFGRGFGHITLPLGEI